MHLFYLHWMVSYFWICGIKAISIYSLVLACRHIVSKAIKNYRFVFHSTTIIIIHFV